MKQALSDKTRLSLYLGFGGLLLLMAVAGVGSIQILREIRARNDSIRSQYLSRNRLLNGIRSDLYLSGTYVRDYLLEPDATLAERHRASLGQVRAKMETALKAYGDNLTAQEIQPYSVLRKELQSYWEVLEPLLRWNADQRRALGYPFLRDEVFPRRTAMLGIADQIATINEQQLNVGNTLFTELFSQFQMRLAITLAATLLLGLSMAAFSTRKILKLENDATERYQEIAKARADLKDLSARLVEVQENERRSISRELHDEVGQSLSAMLVELRNLSAGLAQKPAEELRGHIEVIKSLVEGCVRVVRNMALLLRPSMLDDLGLIPALQWQAREVSRRTSMDVAVATELVSDDLSDEYKTCVYRVVQEALHNCSRHSQATTVRIRVRQEPARLVLSIQDNGVGFDVQQSKGLGLVGIEERVTQLDGTVQVHSTPGGGAILTVELPFAKIGEPDRRNAADSHLVGG